MTDRYTEFLTKLADLMEQYDVQLAAHETDGEIYNTVNGIDILFTTRQWDSEDPSDAGKIIHIGVYTYDITPVDLRRRNDTINTMKGK